MERVDNETKYHGISDLACCAALISHNHKLSALDRGNPRRVQFLFTYDPDIEATEAKFWSDELVVNPRTYFDNLKAVKSRLYSG